MDEGCMFALPSVVALLGAFRGVEIGLQYGGIGGAVIGLVVGGFLGYLFGTLILSMLFWALRTVLSLISKILDFFFS